MFLGLVKPYLVKRDRGGEAGKAKPTLHTPKVFCTLHNVQCTLSPITFQLGQFFIKICLLRVSSQTSKNLEYFLTLAETANQIIELLLLGC